MSATLNATSREFSLSFINHCSDLMVPTILKYTRTLHIYYYEAVLNVGESNKTNSKIHNIIQTNE